MSLPRADRHLLVSGSSTQSLAGSTVWNGQQTAAAPQIVWFSAAVQVGLHGTGHPLPNGDENPPTSTHCPE